MSIFTPAEIEYLINQRLGRLATVNEVGEPHVVPVSFRYNSEFDSIDIGGHKLVAFVVDDLLPPWQPRGIEVRGYAQV